MAEPWRQHAACRGMDPAIFYAEQDDKAVTGVAKRICNDCPVREECLATAKQNHERYGVWGGQTKNERFGRRKKQRQR